METNRNIMAKFDLPKESSSIIKVIGVGGGGSNAVNHMHRQGIKGVDFIVCNTDQQALDASLVPLKIQLGALLTEGRGAGSIPDIGRDAAKENLDEIRDILKNKTKMVFVTAGMGGGTGTGAAPVIAGLAKELGILTVGIVTVPFTFEGRRRLQQAHSGLEELKKNVDTLLVISNDKLREISKDVTITEAFSKADNVLTIAAKGIAEIITVTGYINVDFADVFTVMKDGGSAIMGSSLADGQSRAMDAVKSALNSPLLNDNRIKGAKHVLINITSGKQEVTMDEVGEIIDHVQEEAGQTANVIFGTGFDETLENKICVTVIATGFEIGQEEKAPVVHSLDNTVKTEEKKSIAPVEFKTQQDEAVVNRPITITPEKDELRMLGKNTEGVPNELQMTLTVKTSEDANNNNDSGFEKMAEERRLKLKSMQEKLPENMNAPLSPNEMESIPAYLRRNKPLVTVQPSSEGQLSRLNLIDANDPKKLDIRSNNQFLHDNVD
jgi:cell division protein FtsZ